MAKKSQERLGSVTVQGKKYALNAKVDRPSAATMKANGGVGQFNIGVSTRGLAGGKEFGLITFSLNQKSRTAQVQWISSDPTFKGQGVGNRLYAKAMLEAKQQGATKFTSDARLSTAAVNSWENLIKKLPSGAVTRNAATPVTEALATPGLYAASGAVFSVDLQKVSKSQLSRIAGITASGGNRIAKPQSRKAGGAAAG